MKYWIPFVLTALILAKLDAQTTYFDKLYGFDKLKNNTIYNNYSYKALEFDSSFVMMYITLRPSITKFTNLVTIEKIDGNLLTHKIIGDSIQNNQVLQLEKFSKTKDDNIICLGGYVKVNGIDTLYRAVLYKLKPNGDTIWSKQIKNNYTSDFNTRCLLSTNDGGFILGFTVFNYNLITKDASQYDFWIYKTDSLGNKEWEKRIGNSNINDFEVKIAEAKDGYVMTGYKKKVGGNFLYGYVHKIDKVGNTIWQRDFEPNIYENIFLEIKASQDGNHFYLCGDTEQNVACSDEQCSKARLVKIDNEGKIIWDKRYFSSYSPTGIAYNGFYDCEELPNNNLILAGSSSETMYNNSGGMIMQVNSKGDSLWSRIYDKHEFNGIDYFAGVTLCKDKGFLFTGTALDTAGVSAGGYPIYKAWLLKTDSLGCSVPGCATDTPIEELKQDTKVFVLQPNPATSALVVTFATTTTGKIFLTDITGKPILSENLSNLNSWETDISKMSSGIYLVTVIDQNNVKSTQRLVVIK